MAALVAVVAAAILWRPLRLGAVLLAGAVIPMVAQAISALVELGETPSPTEFGISPAQAAQAGLTIRSGVTLAFWIYCAFVVLLVAACVRMLTTGRPAGPAATAPALAATAPDPTAPDPTAPDPTAPDPTAPDPTAPDPSAPDPTAPDPTAPDPTAPDATPPAVRA
jgi:uncharacterized membrane protein YczE